MHCIYVLKSLKDGGLYVGRTGNLKEQLSEHEKGKVLSTKNRRPFRFMYAEISRSIEDAAHREKYLKTAG